MALVHRGRRNSFDRLAPMEPVEKPWEDGDPDYAEAEYRAAPADPPADLSPRMQEWWRTVTIEHTLESHHLLLLESACRAWDLGETARLELAKEGLVYLNREGEPRPRPEAAVLRNSRAAFGKLVRLLDLDPPPMKRPGGHGF